MAKKNAPTKITQIQINKFRGLNGITIDLGERITLICGKNGTSKSSILGIAAQVFSFRKDYLSNSDLPYKSLFGTSFKSQVSEHFRLSKKFDTTGSMDTTIHIHDGYTQTPAEFSLKLYNSVDRPQPRPVVRGNTIATGQNSSRNATHPVIFLSLKRLMPISSREKYTEHDLEYLNIHKSEFLRATQRLLGKFSTTSLTATTGTIQSAVAHSDAHDQDSVSAGEDNVGQILMAIYSFKKLKSEYANYKGGLLLIDEADAGLFPAAQVELIRMLNKECKALDLQVIMTSHSPTMIEELHEISTFNSSDNRTVYLTDSFGAIDTRNNYTWAEIYADLHQETVSFDSVTSLPQVNIYPEDRECADLFSAIITDRKLKKVTNLLNEVALGCDEYLKLIGRKIPEFTKKSIILLDGDVTDVDHHSSVLKLPTALPPDQLIFEFMFNLPADNIFWKNKSLYTRVLFLKSAEKVMEALNIDPAQDRIDIQALAKKYSTNKTAQQRPLRTIFKDFAHDTNFLKMVNGRVSSNPYRAWVKANPELAIAFRENLKGKVKITLSKGHGVDSAKLQILD